MLSPDSIDFSIESLSQSHDRQNFVCGNEKLDNYLRGFASQDNKRNIANPYVALDLNRNTIIGYYTLSTSSIDRNIIPENINKKLPNYSKFGAILIGRLAVSDNYKGYGWGKLLLYDALFRSLEVSKIASVFVVIVDAIDDEALRFYQKFDFKSFPSQPYTLFKKMSDIALDFKQ